MVHYSLSSRHSIFVLVTAQKFLNSALAMRQSSKSRLKLKPNDSFTPIINFKSASLGQYVLWQWEMTWILGSHAILESGQFRVYAFWEKTCRVGPCAIWMLVEISTSSCINRVHSRTSAFNSSWRKEIFIFDLSYCGP